MKLRYSLRTIGVLLTAVAVFCAWLMQPARTAAAFEAAFRDGNYAHAQSMVDPSGLSSDAQLIFRTLFSPRSQEHPNFDPHFPSPELTTDKQGVWSWLAGRCEGRISYTYSFTDNAGRCRGGNTFYLVVHGNRIAVTAREPMCESAS
jgi:hypothetical protein